MAIPNIARHENIDVLSDRFGDGVAEYPFGRRIKGMNYAAHVDGDDRMRYGVHQRRQLMFAFAQIGSGVLQRNLGCYGLGCIGAAAAVSAVLPLGIEERHTANLNMPDSVVAAFERIAEIAEWALGFYVFEMLIPFGRMSRAFVFVDEVGPVTTDEIVRIDPYCIENRIRNVGELAVDTGFPVPIRAGFGKIPNAALRGLVLLRQCCPNRIENDVPVCRVSTGYDFRFKGDRNRSAGLVLVVTGHCRAVLRRRPSLIV